MFSLAYTGSNLKITETMKGFRRVPCIPHTLQGSSAKYDKRSPQNPFVQCTASIPVFAILHNGSDSYPSAHCFCANAPVT